MRHSAQIADRATPIDRLISDRISLLRFLMIFGIVILHCPPYVPLDETGEGLFPFIKAFFSHGLFRSTVPVLTCISGFLLFHVCLDQKFRDLVVKKSRTLLFPLFLWNFPLVLALYFIQSNGLMAHNFSAVLYPFDLFSMLDKTFGLVSGPLNYPLGFLRDLYVLCLLAPIFGLLLRHLPWIGLVAVCLFFWFDFDGELVGRNTMPINFYMGGMVAVLRLDLTVLDRFAPACLAILITCCALIVAFEIGDRRWFRVVSPFLIWPLTSAMASTAFGSLCRRLSPASFFIFLAHGPVLLIFWLVYQKFLSAVPYELFWLTAPVIVVISCLAARSITLLYTPGLYRIALGTR